MQTLAAYKAGRLYIAGIYYVSVSASRALSLCVCETAALLDTMGTVGNRWHALGVYRHYQKPGRGGHTEASWELRAHGHVGILEPLSGNTIPGGVMHCHSCMTYWVAYDNFGDQKNSYVCIIMCIACYAPKVRDLY